jgi:phage tail-like protein
MNERVSRAALTVSHCADCQRRYPGETVTFYTRVDVAQPLPGFTLRVSLSVGLSLEDCGGLRLGPANTAPAGSPFETVAHPEPCIPLITWDEGRNHVNWQVDGPCAAGDRYEYRAVARVDPEDGDRILESRAVVSASPEGEPSLRDEEIATLAVLARGNYLQYLPAIYEDDAFMGRFLMLFESFWAPIETQIDNLPCYFDPQMTPPEFLPWLASWIDLVLDEQWPEERRRQLLRSAVPLYRKRGTQKGLEDYLEIYAGTRPEVVEHRAQNFVLGPAGQLGQGIALGTANVPHTFTVRLRLPAVEGRSCDAREPDRLAAGGPQELARQRKIEAIIDAQKPAHTRFTLHLSALRSTATSASEATLPPPKAVADRPGEIDAEPATPHTGEKT